MSSVRDSAISITSETKHKNVIIHVEDESNGEEGPASKDSSPSIKSNSDNHVTVPQTTVEDDVHSNNNSVAQSTTVLDVDDGGGETIKDTENKMQTYRKLGENICLGIAIAVVCGIMLTPVILFYTRPDFSNPFEALPTQTSCVS